MDGQGLAAAGMDGSAQGLGQGLGVGGVHAASGAAGTTGWEP